MSSAERVRKFRKRQKQEGMVDLRLDVPSSLRDKLKEQARSNRRTMKEEALEALQRHTVKPEITAQIP